MIVNTNRNATITKYKTDQTTFNIDLADYFVTDRKTTKYPYFFSMITNTTDVCTLLVDAANSHTTHFTTQTAQDIGNTIANALSLIPPNLPSIGYECSDERTA